MTNGVWRGREVHWSGSRCLVRCDINGSSLEEHRHELGARRQFRLKRMRAFGRTELCCWVHKTSGNELPEPVAQGVYDQT